MLTVRPSDFVVGMRIRARSEESVLVWATIKAIYGKHVPNLDEVGVFMVVFETEYGVVAHEHFSSVRYELHPECLLLLAYPNKCTKE
jgi:nitrate reductase NapAB chaperone NapD